ncbi:MAG: outer membrane protein transport protein [Polyangiaceae bacterium]|nr:outer membrane protein transport protein [Polyangiaceae bacterium]
MSHMMRATSTGAVVFLISQMAGANIEPPAFTDGRNAALGGTGVAYTHNGASLYHNPAGLQGIEQGAVTASISPLTSWLKAPVAQPNVEKKSSMAPFPMFLLGGGYRLDERWVIGMAVYPTVGFGASYENLPALGGNDLSNAAALFEAAPGISYAFTKDIAVGLAYRATYMLQSLKAVNVDMSTGAPVMVPMEMDLSGFNFLGAQLGLFARVAESTRLGLTYRSKVVVDLSGDTTPEGGVAMDTETKFRTPHTFKVGVAQGLLQDRLLLALDLKYMLYKESGKQQVVETTLPDGTMQTLANEMDWDNTLTASAGVEYQFMPEQLAGRVGYGISQSATSEKHPQPFLPPPGILHSLHGGLGTTFSSFDVDLGGYYMWGSKSLSAPEPPALPGEYGVRGFLFALSGTYRM